MKKLLLFLTLTSGLVFSFLISGAAKAQEQVNCSDVHRDLFLTAPLMTGPDVLELQERLAELGFNPGLLDGVFGENTQRAVREFQQTKDLAADGVVTLEVWQELGTGDAGSSLPVAGEELAKPKGQVSIVISTDKRTLTVYDDDQVHAVFPVAVGKYNTPSPVGEWRIIGKSANRGGALGSRWMHLNVPWGTYGIHGTNKPYSIGSFASAGCIRMHNRDVEKLYEIIPYGTPVTIIADQYPKYPPGFKKRHLKKGSTGPDVVEMQKKLRAAGIYWGRADSRFGDSTEMFVKRYQAFTGQELTGEFTLEDYEQVESIIAVLEEKNL